MIIHNEDPLRDPKSPSTSHPRCPGKLKDLNVRSGFSGNMDINQTEHERDDQCDGKCDDQDAGQVSGINGYQDTTLHFYPIIPKKAFPEKHHRYCHRTQPN